MEVLIAMALFVVGFIFVAAIFPISSLLQKQATDVIRGQQAARNAKAMLRGRTLKTSQLTDGTYGLAAEAYSVNYDSDRRVYPLPAISGFPFLPEDGYAGPPDNWSLTDRSFPTTISAPEYRSIYWVPMIRDSYAATGVGNRSWEVYIFILKREDNQTYPKPALTAPDRWANPEDPEGTISPSFAPGVPGVRSVGVAPNATDAEVFDFTTVGFNVDRDIQIGDLVLDNFGNIYRVTFVDDDWFRVNAFISPNPETGAVPDTVWYGKPSSPGKGTPTLDVLVLTGVVR